MKNFNNFNLMKKIIYVLERCLCMAIIIAIIISLPDLGKYFIRILHTPTDQSYIVFGDFLKHVLILVVGIELIFMIKNHSHEAMLALVLFVIARKMLVYADGMKDLFMGTLAILVIFLVIKFLTADDKILAKFDSTFSAAMPVEKINKDFKYEIPSDISYTLGGLVYELSVTYGIKLENGMNVKHDKYEYVVTNLNDGVIERVRINELL